MQRILAPKILIFRSRGFTLIEVLMVIGLIALVTVAVIPGLGVALKVNIGTSTRELANTIRSAYDESVLTGKVHRIALDIEKGEYWAEVGNRTFLMQTEEQKKDEEQKLRQLSEEERKSRVPPFSIASKITKNKRKLPKGVHFTEVLTSNSKEPLKAGLAYAHIFPQGFIEKLTIHVKDDFEREATLLVNPVTGKSRLFQRYFKEED